LTTINGGKNDESWGFREFIVTHDKPNNVCPEVEKLPK
jgi:hypothetical protein